MTMISFVEAISISELCVYLPILILTIIIIFRQGFQRQLGWIFLCTFCLIRLIGAAFKIASIHDPTNRSDIRGAAILNSIGLSPLLLASLGLLKRITDQCSTTVRSNSTGKEDASSPAGGIIGRLARSKMSATSRRSRIIQLIQIPAMLGFILCIAGGLAATSSNTSHRKNASVETKAGIAIFCMVYVVLAVLVIVTTMDVRRAQQGEKRIFVVVAVALPLIAVRLSWSVIAAFTHNKDFSVVSGKPIIQLCMATVQEFVVVVLYTTVGLTLWRKHN